MVELNSLLFALRYPKVSFIQAQSRYKLRQNPPYDERGINIHQEDWDTILILDACRYDTFANRSTISGELSSVRSRGSTSQEWVRGNFTKGEFGDLVIVSANPWYKKLAEEIDLQVHDFTFVEPADEETGLTPPEKVTEHVLDTAEQYPDKRLLAHYMQPHAPYVGPTGEDITFRAEQLQKAVKNSQVTPAKLKQAYTENFDLVQDAIEPVLDHRPGKTVISADHGELLGEPLFSGLNFTSFYGHPYGIQHKAVRTVPWHIVDYDKADRPDITTGGTQQLTGGDVDNQLRALGYL